MSDVFCEQIDLFYTVLLAAGMPENDAKLFKAMLPSLAKSQSAYAKWNRPYTAAEITPALLVLESKVGPRVAQEYVAEFAQTMADHFNITDAKLTALLTSISRN